MPAGIDHALMSGPSFVLPLSEIDAGCCMGQPYDCGFGFLPKVMARACRSAFPVGIGVAARGVAPPISTRTNVNSRLISVPAMTAFVCLQLRCCPFFACVHPGQLQEIRSSPDVGDFQTTVLYCVIPLLLGELKDSVGSSVRRLQACDLC